jgi:hypothetical protein
MMKPIRMPAIAAKINDREHRREGSPVRKPRRTRRSFFALLSFRVVASSMAEFERDDMVARLADRKGMESLSGVERG